MAAKKKIQTAALSQSDPMAPLDAAAFLSAAQRILAVLRDDLLTRADQSPGVTESLKAQWMIEKEAKRTGDPWEVWRRRVVVQVAAAWVLSLVFVRTLEDRGLLERNRIAGPGAADSQEQFRGIAPYLSDRDYLLTVFQELSNLPAAKDLFDPAHNPVWKLGPSIDGVRALLDLFRSPDPEAPAFRFGQGDTRFLGDLYQSLDEETSERFALLQTPHFVEAYILDRTLERAIARFGLDDTTLIDPTCGSGHFLHGAFERLVDHRLRKEPALDVREAARRALDAVYGVDINPYAVAIARFRLALSFIQKAGYLRIADAPSLPLHLAVADSLLHNPQHGQAKLGEVAGQSMRSWGGEDFALEDESAARDVLHGRYAAVVGNPPYITVKDAALRERYREMYATAFKTYSLGVPFTERFFQLARNSGFVGMITANSFMKREFGRKLIEEYLPQLNLDGIVNTSGAYIPGHGTPTVLLFGINEPPAGKDVLSVLAKRGEPTTPLDAEQGKVWQSVAQHGNAVGFENEYISVARVPRATLSKHPWSLGGGGTAEVKEFLESRAQRRLGDLAETIGVACITKQDDVFSQPRWVLNRAGIESGHMRRLVIGEEIRDWAISDGDWAIFPYDKSIATVPVSAIPNAIRFMWPFRRILEDRKVFGGQTYRDVGKPWYEYGQIPADRFGPSLTISFAFIASHNHFVLSEPGNVFNRSAPIIKLRDSATEAEHLSLLAYLNSSAACFWIKQVSHNKGTAAHNRSTQDEPARVAYEFAATQLGELPLFDTDRDLASRLTALASTIATLARERVDMVVDEDLHKAALNEASATSLVTRLSERDNSLLERMIWLQEELDWTVYRILGLVEADHLCELESTGASETMSCPLGARPFEMIAARGGRFAGIDGQVLHDEMPSAFPESTARIWEKRIAAIARSDVLQRIEMPDFKRRWLITLRESAGRVETFDDRLAARVGKVAVQELESCFVGRSPTIVSQREMVAASRGVEPLLDVVGVRNRTTLANLLHEASVPFLARYRFTSPGLEKRAAWEHVWERQRAEDRGEHVPRYDAPPKFDHTDYSDAFYWRLRGKLDVRRERFVSYPGCESDEDKEPVYGWAGWNYLEQAIALATLYLGRKQGEAWGRDRLVPMLAGLEELLPWIWQWHPDPTPESGGMKPGQYIADFLSAQCQELGVTLDEVRMWRPEPKKNGVRAAKKTRTAKSKASVEEETP